MNNHDYEKARQECWDALRKELLDGEVQWQPVSRKEIVNFVFDRAYALGKKKETITQEEIKKAAEKYSQSLGKSRDVTWNDGEYGFIAGANFALGKKIGISEFYDTEDTVIQGWASRDKDGALIIWESKPQRNDITNDEWGMTDGIMLLPSKLFPDLTWSDEPQEVEIILKRK